MRSLLLVLPFVLMTVVCWGSYGPVLHEGQHLMGADHKPSSLRPSNSANTVSKSMGADHKPSSLRPFICVGIAYFLVAVVVPVVWLRLRGESGRWTTTGTIWSFGSGIAGAVGALGIILAFKSGGRPVYVMPLVFGLAPVVNTLITMKLTHTYRRVNAIFITAIAVTAVGAAGVLFFKPGKGGASIGDLGDTQFAMMLLSIATTAVCWGAYGPVLHKGQAKMEGSRLRPFLCVGLAYFLVAVAAPLAMMPYFDEPGGWRVDGSLVSLAAGAAGALGALGVIMAFNFGGRPIYVMPLIFGGAPVVNTITTLTKAGTFGDVGPLFFLSLLMVIVGSTGVLVFSPKPGKK
jgi:hypothetical protein